MKKPYFPLFIDISQKSIVVVGGGRIAERRVKTLLQFAEDIRVISPKLTEELRCLAESRRIEWIQKRYIPGQLAGAFFVLAATDDAACNEQIVTDCRKLGILYESTPYHNAVFVGMDEAQNPRYAFLRGIYEKDGKAFRIEQAGSEKKYAFCVPPSDGSIRVAVYEACIDALAHMTLEEGRADKYRLALGGISAPKEARNAVKETQIQETWGSRNQRNPAGKHAKDPPALVQFLKLHPEIQEIEICTDNDFAGRWACNHIKEAYGMDYRIIENLPQIEGADYGDLAAQEMENKKAVSREAGQGR